MVDLLIGSLQTRQRLFFSTYYNEFLLRTSIETERALLRQQLSLRLIEQSQPAHNDLLDRLFGYGQ